jgi:penicillin-binding protein 1C
MILGGRKLRKQVLVAAFIVCAAGGAFAWKTRHDLLPLPMSLTIDASHPRKVQVLDRHAVPLTVTYQNLWNIHDYVPLHEIPLFLQRAFVVSEDRRFFEHNGVDWRARLHALWQNMKAFRIVRGASTISEQTIRMLHPRPRTIWSRWLEGFEARRLEERFSKAAILEFYMNQIPYAAKRRGVVQAARYYFDRDLETLSQKEMLALAVMIRAPGRLNLHVDRHGIQEPLGRLCERMREIGLMNPNQCQRMLAEEFQIRTSELTVDARHFVHHIYKATDSSRLQALGRLHTTLDSGLQHKGQWLIDTRLRDLRGFGATNGALLVVDHNSQEVLAWVNAVAGTPDLPESWIDGITTPRQPGSTLKPFLYAMTLEEGWTAATLLNDEPLSESVGVGLHTYHNYSRTHYGPVRLRDALGNSLNVPAIKAIQYVGIAAFLSKLQEMGVLSLRRHPDYYGDGLALGNGEITLLELVRAYTVLARQGMYRPLVFLKNDGNIPGAPRRVFSPEVSSLVADILSDPDARKLEFGGGGLLRFPVQTAVKTGTSSDYRDAWAVGFDNRYTVGVWMGNLDGQPMDGITGSKGPMLVLRAVFAELNRTRKTRPLYLDPRLIRAEICRGTGLSADGECPSRNEWFLPGSQPAAVVARENEIDGFRICRPTHGLQMAVDPRIPDDMEAFTMRVCGTPDRAGVNWIVDGVLVASTREQHLIWPLRRGRHRVKARAWIENSTSPLETEVVSFIVK